MKTEGAGPVRMLAAVLRRARDLASSARQLRIAHGLALCVWLVALSTGCQGCSSSDLPKVEGYFPIGSLDVPTHTVAFWRQQPEIFLKAAYTNPTTGEVRFNSCMDPDMSAQDVCNGHGFCSPFDRNNIVKPLFFCKCDMYYAGPECEEKQKSQITAWLLSLFFGFVGADQAYLGWTFWCFMKVVGFTVSVIVGCLGFPRPAALIVLSYWFADIVEIGSAPVRAVNAKIAADLPRWAFAIFTLLYFAFIGFAMGVASVYWKVKHKRRKGDHSSYYYGAFPNHVW